MTIAALITENIWKEVAEKSAKSSGKRYVDMTLRLKTDAAGGQQFCRATAFDKEVMAECLTLAEGDAITVRGRLKAEVWEGKLSLSIVADKIVALSATLNKVDTTPKQRGEPVRLGEAVPEWVKRGPR